MEAITHLVAESLARHGLDRPVDPRRLQWSRWFRCDSPRSLLIVPSKPGIFAVAEEVMEFGNGRGAADAPVRPDYVGTAALEACPERSRRTRENRTGPPERSPATSVSAPVEERRFSAAASDSRKTAAVASEPPLGGAALQRCDSETNANTALAAEAPSRRMLAVLQFSEDDDMAFTLDRMFTRENPMRTRLWSGRCFLRFVVIQDQSQRGSICSALNQWMASSAEKASGLPADFASSLELARVERPAVGRTLLSTNAEIATKAAAIHSVTAPAAQVDSGAAANLHCPHPLPSGF